MFKLKLAHRGRPVRRSGRKEVVVALPEEGVAEVTIEGGDEAAAVANVEVVPPVTRRYRAVVSRTVTQRAVIEFDAEETADPYAMTDEILAMVTETDWQVSDTGLGYIESIEPVEPAAEVVEEVVTPPEAEVEIV